MNAGLLRLLRGLPALTILCCLTTLLLAQASLLSLAPVILLPAGLALLLRRVLFPAEEPSPQPLPRWTAAALALLLALFAVVVLRPHELIDGGWDPSTYLCGGASMARSHGVSWSDPLLASLTPGERRILVPSLALGQKYPGFYTRGDKLTPQGQHLYTSLVAVAVLIAGPRGGLYVNPLLALVSLLLLFGLALSFRGPKTALVAALLFAASPVQLWNARFASAEITSQVLLLSAFLLLDRAMRRHDPAAAALAALGFWLAVQSSIAAAAFSGIPLAAVLLPWPKESGRSRGWFAAGAVVGGLHFALQGFLLTPRYAALVGSFFRVSRAALLVAAAIALLIPLIPAVRRRIEPLLPRILGGPAPAIAALAPLAAAIWLRPVWFPGEDARTLSALAFYFAPWMVGLGIAGMTLLLLRPTRRAESLLILSALAGLLFFAWDLRMIPLFPFSLRRFTPLAIPVLALCAAVALDRLARIRIPLALPAAASLLALAVAHPLHRTWGMHTQTENKGLLTAVTNLARQLPTDGVLLCQGRNPGYALEHLFGRKVVIVDRLSSGEAAAMLAWAEGSLRRGSPIHLLTPEARPWTERLLFAPLLSVELPILRQHQDPKRWSPRFREAAQGFTLYRIENGWGGMQSRADDTMEVDIGENPFGLTGFSGRVRFTTGNPPLVAGVGRWTGGTAIVTIPRPSSGGTLVLWAGSGEKRSPLARLRLSLDGTPLGELPEVPAGVVPLPFPFPPAPPGTPAWSPARLRIDSTTWNPASKLGADQPRIGGVLVDRIGVTANTP